MDWSAKNVIFRHQTTILAGNTNETTPECNSLDEFCRNKPKKMNQSKKKRPISHD